MSRDPGDAEGVPGKRRTPLGLPSGSVRAILTLIIVTQVIVLTVRAQPMTVLLAETLMVALAHYFTSRRLLKLPPRLRRQLETEGVIADEPQPLYLPRHAVRMLIVGAFVVTAAYMVYEGRLLESAVLGTFGLLFAYFLGVAASAVFEWWSCRRPTRGEILGRWEDIKALIVILVTAVAAATDIVADSAWLPAWARNASFGLVLFYFGSR